MRLFREYLRGETRALRRERRPARGDRPARPARPRAPAGAIEARRSARPRAAPGCILRIALDYSSRDAILRAAQCLQPETVPAREAFGRLLAIVDHGTPVPEVDLLIRTGGERRLSDFLLWEAPTPSCCSLR